jgi:hypothetical protein
MAGPGASSARGRAPARGGLWDDEPRPRRPGAGDPRGGPNGARYGARDPRVLRRGLVPEDDGADETNNTFTAGKGLLVVVLVFLLSAGAAFGYYKLSKPTVPASVITSPTVPATTAPSASPSASPNASPTGSAHP